MFIAIVLHGQVLASSNWVLSLEVRSYKHQFAWVPILQAVVNAHNHNHNHNNIIIIKYWTDSIH